MPSRGGRAQASGDLRHRVDRGQPEEARRDVEGLDYIFTGTLRREGAEFVLILRVWEVKKLRERKQLTVRWTAATADAELTKLHE